MKKGYGVFGRAYEVMNRNDLHHSDSIDHRFLQEMVLLEECSKEALYGQPLALPDGMERHELYGFAMQFRGKNDRESIGKAAEYLGKWAAGYDVPFEEMRFGGTEREILERGTDWCADISRVGCVVLQCLGVPARIVHLANLERAYNGHVMVEAYYEGKYGLVDFLYGLVFYENGPVSAWDVWEKGLPEAAAARGESYAGLFRAIALNSYDPMGDNNYTVSAPNAYTRRLIEIDHQDRWIMGEDG
ncbi:MAG: hypothetical protein HFJ86_09295 [Oscillospiraceae bacterium]|jgi:hypothetical protein|nr:hypothetical protein [Oscillospiraceae bacterium]